MSRRPPWVAVALLVGAVALTACTGSGAAPIPDPGATELPSGGAQGLARFYQQRPAWEGCGNGFECTRIEIPLDYADPSGATIELALTRRLADDRDEQTRALLVNPGGPGVSGISYARNAGFFFSDDVRGAFDIVGWDPRGVQSSTAVDCLDDAQIDEQLAADGTPDSRDEERQIQQLVEEFVTGCQERSGDLLPHLGTPNAARDMDVIRAVLGQAEMDFFGASYGTALGATYADLFPDRVGRLVLDGALDPTLGDAELSRGQLEGFQLALDSFVADCVTRNGCPIGPTPSDGIRQIRQLLADVDQRPLTGDDERDVTESLASLGIITAMYDEASGWPALRIGLQQAFQGDGTVLLALADSYSDRGSDGTFTSNVNEAFPAISCTDRPSTRTVRQVRRDAIRYSEVSSVFGEFFAWGGLACNGWPTSGRYAPKALPAIGAAPILVIGTTRDPATPYAWSVSLAEQLDSGVLLTREGDGHTAYRSGNPCIDESVDGYLVNGVVPPDGARC